MKQVGRKLQQVLHPKGDRSVLKDWDLWGPLILCLALAITLSTSVPSDQSVPIFTGVFVIVWLGAAVVTMNAKLLGGSVSFFQSVCVIGYCIFPLVVVAFIAIFVETVWFRVPASLFAFGWSTYGKWSVMLGGVHALFMHHGILASIGFLSESKAHLANRRALAVSIIDVSKESEEPEADNFTHPLGIPSLSLLPHYCLVSGCIMSIVVG